MAARAGELDGAEADWGDWDVAPNCAEEDPCDKGWAACCERGKTNW